MDLEANGLLDDESKSIERKIGKKTDNISLSCLCDYLRCPMEPKIPFLSSLYERTSWLAGLLILQSCSSFILEANINLMESHPAIIYFLTVYEYFLM
jgi:hypothetical protein